MIFSKILRQLLIVMFCVGLLTSFARAATLTHSAMIGAVTDTSANIWIRSDVAVASAVVQYQPTGGNWSQPLQSAAISLVAGNDFTGTLSLTNLSASTSYDYRVILDGVIQPTGTSFFKTFPPAGTGSKFTFVFGGDINRHFAPHTIFGNIATHQPNLLLTLGDNIYYDVDYDPTIVSGAEPNFWTSYKLNHDSFFQSLANHTPIYAVWDDHDYGAADAGSTLPLKFTARAAFGKYWANPPYVEQNASIYYKFSVGDSDYFMLDSRWNNVTGVTMLGAAQLQWLKNQLLASKATFKFIGSPLMVSDEGTTGADGWSGFPAERASIFQFIAQNNIKNVIFLSADQHWAGAFLINYPVFQIGHAVQGFYEVSTSPYSAQSRGAPQVNPSCQCPDPQILFEADQNNYYGLARVDTTIVPRQVQFEIHRGSDDAIVYSEIVEEFTPTQSPTVFTTSVQQGYLNSAYSQTLAAAAGVPPYQWSLSNGSLPSGLTLSPNGIISGTPTQAGTFFFTISVQDSVLATGSRTLSLVINSSPPPASIQGLVGYWSFDDGTATDNSGSGNNGTLINGAVVVAGKIGQALNFNGTSQYINVGNVLNPGSGDLSVFAWVKTTQGGGLNMVISKRNSSVTTNSGYQLFQNGSGALSFTFGNGQSSRVRVDSSGPRINDGLWHFVGVVYTRSGNGVIYVDGAAATGGTGSITSQSGFVSNTVPLRFGLEDQIGSNFYWNGSIDEVRIYNRALAAQEILNLYNGVTTVPLSVVTNALPSGAVNVSYPSQTLVASGGTAPYTWSVSAGTLPAGLSLSSSGTILGTPTLAGTTSFTVQVKDNALATATQSFNLTINPASLSIVASTLPSGTVNVAYNQSVTASGGPSPYTWTLQSGSVLPQGLSLSAGGTISGTPTAAGASTFTVQVQDNALRTATQSLSLTINPASTPISIPGLVGYWSFDDGTASDNSGNGNNGTLINGPTVVAGKIGQALSFNGAGQYVNVGNVLNPGSGDLSVFAWVKTTQSGGLNMIISKRNSSVSTNGGYQLFQNGSGALSFTFGDGNSSRVRVDSTAPRVNDGNWHLAGVVFTRAGNGVIYVDGVQATGGTGSITSQSGSVANSLPLRFGLEDQTSQNFLYWQGAIDEARIYNRALSAQEVSNLFGGATTPSLAISTTTVPAGTVSVSYNQSLTASGGTPPYTWSLASGNLPQGLVLSPSGTISGTPTAAGTASFTVQVRDNVLATATQSLNLTINPASNSPTVSLSFDGKLRDRVGQAELALSPDGQLDGVFTVTLNAGSGNRTVTRLQLNRGGPIGVWDTQAGDGFWSLGAALGLDTPLLNNVTNDSVNFAVTDGSSFKIFAADYQGQMFVLGSAFTLTANFADGSTATANMTISAVPTVGLVGYWSFDDGTAADNSGNGNNGTLVNNPIVVTGKAGQALSFDGNSQYVNIGNVLDPRSGDLSIFASVKTTQVGGLNMLISKRNSSVSTNAGYQLFQNGSGALSFTFGDGASSRVRVDSTAPRINDGNWHVVGVVFTRSGNGVIYVDGVPATSGTGSITSQSGNVANSLPLRFSLEDQTSQSFYWRGVIDEVRIYNRALSTQEVAAIQ